MLLFNFNVHKGKMSLFVDCGSSYTLENGAVNFTGIKTTFQHTAPVYCDEGYKIHGSHQITCHSDGQWSQYTKCRISVTYQLSKAILYALQEMCHNVTDPTHAIYF